MFLSLGDYEAWKRCRECFKNEIGQSLKKTDEQK